MANVFLKTSQIVSAGLGVLEREVVLQNLISSDASRHFTGRSPKGDTVSIRIDGRTKAHDYAWRNDRSVGIETSDLNEFKVDVKLDTHVYNSIQLTDEELTLDIDSFSETVIIPQTRSVAERIEDKIAAAIAGATYGTNTATYDAGDFHGGIVDARKLLNDANVPQSDRVLIVGTAVEADILKSEQFKRFDQSGDNGALRNATIGSIAGMNVVVTNSIIDTEAYAFHKSAFQAVYRVPNAPLGGVETGSGNYAGMAMRWVKDYDPKFMINRSTFDTFFGISAVTDPDDYSDSDSPLSMRRAVKIDASGLGG